MGKNDGTVLMEGVPIIYRNFSGKEGPYNRAGDMNFNVVLDEKVAKAMLDDGWNVKQKDRELDEGDVQTFWTLEVTVNFKGPRPPRIVLITSRGRNNLGPDEVAMLDWAEIVNADLIVRPYEWTVNGKSGIKAYLQSLYVTIEEDPLERKYAEMEEENAG